MPVSRKPSLPDRPPLLARLRRWLWGEPLFRRPLFGGRGASGPPLPTPRRAALPLRPRPQLETFEERSLPNEPLLSTLGGSVLSQTVTSALEGLLPANGSLV